MSLDQLDRDAARLSADLLVRPAMAADSEACGTIIHDAFEASAAAHGFVKDFACRDSAIRLARAMIADPGVFGVVAEQRGRILGSAFLSERDEIRSVGPVSVEPGAQERGTGRRLMQAMLDRAWGTAGVRLVQDAFNARSLALFASLGFEVKAPLLLVQGFPRAESPRGAVVRPMLEADIPACDALSAAAHGIVRTHELREALMRFGPMVVTRNRQVTGYLTAPGQWLASHGVAETEDDMCTLLAGAAAARGEPVSLLLPSRQSGLLRWCLGAGMRVVKPMTLMSRGTYRVPARPWFPSVFY